MKQNRFTLKKLRDGENLAYGLVYKDSEGNDEILVSYEVFKRQGGYELKLTSGNDFHNGVVLDKDLEKLRNAIDGLAQVITIECIKNSSFLEALRR